MSDESKASGFRDWSLGKCEEFMARWEYHEQWHGEQASLAITCEEYGVDYMLAEWVDIAVAIEEAKDHV